MKILGIETTCDETGVALVNDGRKVLSSVVSSSVNLHRKYKGVVPEVAAREQVRIIIPAIAEVFQVSGVKFKDIDAIAVAYGPGLVGSLLIGVETAKTLALVCGKPLMAVNHLMGHVYANWLTVDSSQLTEEKTLNRHLKTINLPQFPIVALIVSGGHTDLILMTDHGKFKWLGGTRDDAAGEAFDKVARVLGLGYPGGPEVERVARRFTVGGSPTDAKALAGEQLTVKFPRPMISSNDFDFSFSGLKTAVANLVNSSRLSVYTKSEIAYEFQEAICDVLVTKTLRAAKKFGAESIVVGGGVAANERLRSQFTVHGSRLGIPVFFPLRSLAVDNGAMIAAAAFYQRNYVDPLKIQAEAGLYF